MQHALTTKLEGRVVLNKGVHHVIVTLSLANSTGSKRRSVCVTLHQCESVSGDRYDDLSVDRLVVSMTVRRHSLLPCCRISTSLVTQEFQRTTPRRYSSL